MNDHISEIFGADLPVPNVKAAISMTYATLY
jgi:hypothetical protein